MSYLVTVLVSVTVFFSVTVLVIVFVSAGLVTVMVLVGPGLVMVGPGLVMVGPGLVTVTVMLLVMVDGWHLGGGL